MEKPAYDVERLRAQIPALASGIAFFDGPGGTQTPRFVIEAMATALAEPLSNRGRGNLAESNADDIVLAARAAGADLLGADPQGIVFGRSMTQLAFDVARTLAADWGPGDEVVVTRLDHDGHVRPWVRHAERVGATVRWVPFDKAIGELTPEHVEGVLSDRTRLVAVTGASNLIGTRPDIPAIAALVQQIDGALLSVDGVHLTPHASVDAQAMGADFFFCSPYKFLGPHLGMLAASPALLETLHPDKLRPSTEQVPERFELGTLPYEMLAGVVAAIDVLAALVPGNAASRRERLEASMAALEAYEDELRDRLREGLSGIPGSVFYSNAARRTPTELFALEGRSSSGLAAHLATRGVNAPFGSFYAIEAAEWLGLGEQGAVRAGIAPYTSTEDVDRLLGAVDEFASA